MNDRRFKDLYIYSDYRAPEAILRKYAQHRLSPNVSNWPVEILKIMGEDYPFIAQNFRPAAVDLEKVDKDTGSGFGGIIVWASPAGEPAKGRGGEKPIHRGPTLIIPFVVRNFTMSPLDVFISGNKVLPLTPRRIQQALMTTQIFSGVDRSRKGPMDSLIDQLSPPPEAFYGQFGRPYGETKSSSARKQAGAISTQDSLIVNQILSAVSPSEMKYFREVVYKDPATLAQYVRNKNIDILDRILKARPITPDDFKNVARWAFPKNVLLFRKKGPGQWCVVMYNDHYSVPDTITASEAQLMEQFKGVAGINEKLWSSDGFIVTVNHKEVDPIVWHEDMAPLVEQIHSPGVWLAITDNKQVEKGFAWKGFCDYDCNPQDYILWYDGDCFTVQDAIVGDKVDEDWVHEEGFLKPGIWGTFLHEHEDGERIPVMPFKIHAVYANEQDHPGCVIIRATDLFGHDVTFILDPCIGKWRSAVGVLSAPLASELGARAFFVPKSTPFVTLGSQRIRMAETAREIRTAFRDTAMANINAWRDKASPATTLVVTCTDKDSHLYRVEGNAQEILCGQNACDDDELHAKWTLVMLGCSVEDAERIIREAHARPGRHIYVMGLRPMKAEANLRIGKLNDEILKVSEELRRNLWKEAAYIRDKNSVDALLALNFITPNNLIVFLENMGKFRDVEEYLAKLLLMTRFGLEAVPEHAVANALKNLNVVNESLEMLRGVIGTRITPDGDVADQASTEPMGMMVE